MKRLPLFVTLTLFILSMVFVATYLVVREFNHQTSTALDRREGIATLGASLIHEKFDRIISMGTVIVSQIGFLQSIEKGNWGEVTKSMDGVLQACPCIDTIVFFDKEGVLKATIPPMPEVIGKSFAYRDYYKGVSKDWKPYVSEVFKRAVEPKYNIVSVAVPVRSHDQKVFGILLLSIKLDTIADWSNELSIGHEGFIYIVDKKGQLVAHPQMKLGDAMPDYSSIAVIQKLLKGERGVEVFFDPIDNDEDLVAYVPVQDYGFGVMVAQPTDVAFAERKSQVIELILFWTIVIFSASGFLYRVLKDRITLKAQRDREIILLESIGDGVVAIDRDWNITLWNKSASVLTGWSKEEAIGKPLRAVLKFIRERDRAENLLFIEDAMIRGTVSTMMDNTLLIRKDGSEVAVGDSAAPVFGKGEKPEGAIVVFHDMSKSRESMHLRSDFVYASHQLRTPVTEALWNLEVAIEEQDPGKKKEDLHIVYQSLMSIKKLSEHLVAVSEIDQDDVAVKPSAVKFIDVLTEVQSKVEALAKERDVTLSIAPVSPLMAINTDQKLLRKALFEIVENAVTYSNRGGKVDVAVTLQEKNILIEVVDAGVGVTGEEQAILFTKFFRGSNRGKENAGDGLGLYIAKAYIALLGGKIWFESEEGKGTTFYITLPVA